MGYLSPMVTYTGWKDSTALWSGLTGHSHLNIILTSIKRPRLEIIGCCKTTEALFKAHGNSIWGLTIASWLYLSYQAPFSLVFL